MDSAVIIPRPQSKVVRFLLASAWLGVLTLIAAKLSAQALPQGAAKPRLELADTARASRQAALPAPAGLEAPPATPPGTPPGTPPATRPATRPATATTMATSSLPVARAAGGSPRPAGGPDLAPGFRADFVRNQTILGVAIYAPAFATTVSRDGLAWGASYLLVAGGSFVAAAELSREMTVSDPMQRLATGAPIRGALAGYMLASTFDGDRRGTAASVLVGSLASTATALWLGRRYTDGEAAATLFGADVLGLGAYGAATAAGLQGAGSPNKTRAGLALAGMVIGAPLGQAYAAGAPYHVTVGDLTAMSAAGGVGMLAGLTTIASGPRTDREVAAALAIGGAAGLVVGDVLLVRRYDHTPEEGRLIMAGGTAGGLMGAGVALLAGRSQGRFNTFTALLTTAGAAGGIVLAQRYLMPKADGALRLGGLRINPLGVVAAAAGMRGAYTLGSLSF